MRRLIAVLIATLFVLSASSAWAIDGYKDRHGIFYGGGIGGGPGSVQLADEAFESGIERSGDLGLAPHLIIGGGARDNLLFGAEVNSWIRTVDHYGNQLNHQQWSFNAVTNFFVLQGLYLEGGLGLGYAFSDAVTNAGDSRRYQEMGISTKLGLGIEYFLDGTMAAGMRFGYTRHFYSSVDFDTLIGNIYLRWY